MRFTRLAALTVSTAVLALGVQGCSGGPADSPAASRSESGAISTTERDEDGVLDDGSGDMQRKCDVRVEVTGGADVTWKVEGESVQPASGSPAAYYIAEKDDHLIQVFSAGGEIESSSAVVSVDGTTYTTNPTDSTGVEASADGTSASVDSQADSADGSSVDLVAEFSCGGAEKLKRKDKKKDKKS